jgi:hypothetical protein
MLFAIAAGMAALGLAIPAPSPRPLFRWSPLGASAGVAGAAVHGETLLVWGDRIEWRPLAGGVAHAAPFPTLAACWMDVDGDGLADVAACERSGALVWYRAPAWRRQVVGQGVDAPDLMGATLFGRRGVLLIHKRMVLRFYPAAVDSSAAWPERDLYSIYTPSWQGGLATVDVDGDGRLDILCGNYWVRAPERDGLPWRLFAINTWTEEEASGMMRVAPFGRGMATAQRLLPEGRVAWLEKPADPREQWTPRLLGRFDRPDSLEAADFDGDGAVDLIVAERGAAGRVVLLRGPGFTPVELRRGEPVVALRAVPRAGRPPDLALVTARGVEYGRNRSR